MKTRIVWAMENFSVQTKISREFLSLIVAWLDFLIWWEPILLALWHILENKLPQVRQTFFVFCRCMAWSLKLTPDEELLDYPAIALCCAVRPSEYFVFILKIFAESFFLFSFLTFRVFFVFKIFAESFFLLSFLALGTVSFYIFRFVAEKKCASSGNDYELWLQQEVRSWKLGKGKRQEFALLQEIAWSSDSRKLDDQHLCFFRLSLVRTSVQSALVSFFLDMTRCMVI